MKSAPQKTIEVSVTRLIQAPPADIYDVWLDAKRPGSPWFDVARAILGGNAARLYGLPWPPAR